MLPVQMTRIVVRTGFVTARTLSARADTERRTAEGGAGQALAEVRVRAAERRRAATTNAEPTHSAIKAIATIGEVPDAPVFGSVPEIVTFAESTSVAPEGSVQVELTVTVPLAEVGSVTVPVKPPVASAVVLPADAEPTEKSTLVLAAQPLPETVTVPPAGAVPELTVKLPVAGG
jgi:hypothetical protein